MRGYFTNLLGCFILCTLLAHYSQGQDAIVLSASLQSMGGTGVSLPWAESLNVNPAAGSSSNFVVGVSYQNRFMLRDLSARDATLILPLSASRLVCSFGQFGSDAFKESHFGIGLARTFGDRISGGIQFHYFQLRMEESERKPGFVTFSLGLLYKWKTSGFGFSCFNPVAQKMTQQDFKREYPLTMRLGVHKIFGEQIIVASQITCVEGRKLNAHVGLQHTFLDRFRIRAGVQTVSPGWSFGLGFLFGKLQTDFTFSCHEYLGFSPSVSLYFKQP